MDNRRWIAFFLFTLGVVLLFNAQIAKQQKQQQEARRQAEKVAREQEATTETLALKEGKPEPGEAAQPSMRAPDVEELEAEATSVDRESAPTVEVETKTCKVVFSLLGAVPIHWELTNLTAATSAGGETSTTASVNLVPETSSRQREYPFTIEGRGLDVFNDVLFTAEKNELPGGGVELVLTSAVRGGLQMVKSFQFPADDYLIPMTVTVRNGSELRKLFGDQDAGVGIGWQGGFMPPEENSRVSGYLMGLVANQGGIRSEQLKSKDDEPTTVQGPVYWAGVERKFFLVSLIPGEGTTADRALVTVRERDVTLDYEQKGIAPPISVVVQQDPFELEPGESTTLAYWVFAGPKNYELLQSVDREVGLEDKVGLSAAVFHNTFRVIRWLSLVLLTVLKWVHGVTSSYGYAIILLTIMVRVITYPLTHKSMKIQAKTMAQQAKLKPYIDEINKKYKDDPAKKNQAMMKLWKEHGVNPFGMLRGCIPVLLQMPIFIALYYLLDQAIELRGQSFYWISDLSMPDRLLTFPGFRLPLIGVIASLNILPILMGLTQVVSSRMTMSAAADPTQRQMMMFMPLAFVFLLYNFPSGLMLYWVVTNLWQIGQQKLTNRLIQREQGAAEAPARG